MNIKSILNVAVCAIFVAVVQLISGTVSLALYVKNLVSFGHFMLLETNSNKVDFLLELQCSVYAAWAVCICYLILWLLTALVFLYGITQKKSKWLTAWLIFGIISLLLSVIYIIIIFVAQPKADRISIKIIDILIAPLGIWSALKLKGDFQNEATSVKDVEKSKPQPVPKAQLVKHKVAHVTPVSSS